MINIQGLSQYYGKKIVLNDVHLGVEEKERCALVGRNGSGKSTLIHSMLGLLPVKKGSILLGGHCTRKTDKWKKEVAYLPEKFHLYPQLTANENLRFFAELQDSKPDDERVEQVLTQVRLEENRSDKIHTFSKGMLQRLGLALMLYYDAKLLILDEPTSGLDPIGRAEILSILQSLKDKTIFLSSHHMDEIQQVCTHVAYLNDGKITKYTVADFTKKMGEELAYAKNKKAI
ncbi:ABC-2 type transport system ATP-binding protein [Evansella vedderi]|uniref:ABC-2 type transport system ATP-binding protein n=1 Tax=Evansella vedderi TaxID=38282 RepID=A0ABT9ZPX4_9BACI|nr:ABC transporter ATP-binding protein [Evansella vedderi]MDQ0253293.1 ABC-2 type transport system ATP-binding protein [Evansella vedderi]